MIRLCTELPRLLIFLLIIFHTGASHAELFRGPVASSLAGAGIAGIPGPEGALLNPALVPIYGESGIDAYFRDGDLDRGQHRFGYGLGAIDNAPDVLAPGALHYIRTRDTGRASQPVNGELWHGAIGQRIDQLAFGISVYRLEYFMPGAPRLIQWNGAFGAVYMFNPNLGVAYVLRNPAISGSIIPVDLREQMQQVVGLLAGIADTARIRVDILRQERENPDHKLAYMVGLESKTNKLFSFRVGYKYDDLTAQRLWTAGFGFDGPRLRAQYSFEKSQERTSGALHSVDLSLPF